MKQYLGRCHCGAVRFRVVTDLSDPVRCNCSFCSRRGALMHNVEPAHFELLAGADRLTHYAFGTRTVRHSFCRRCGIFTFFHSRYQGEDMYVVNIGCLEGADPDALTPRLVDGRSF
jgi:hypothetical protein